MLSYFFVLKGVFSMYLYLGKKEQNIEDKKYYLFNVLYHDIDKDNYSVCRIYALKTSELESDFAFISQFEDITDRIGFKVRNDGKVVLTLK